MARISTVLDESGKNLVKLLLNAAGIPEDKHRLIKAVTCRAAYNETISFTIEKHGDQDEILEAIEGKQE